MKQRSAISFALALAVTLGAASASAAPIESNQVEVLDGDTIRLNQIKPDVRLVNFNAPETTSAKCDAERALGQRAARRLRELVQAGGLEFVSVKCSCVPSTAGTRYCNRGRRCGTLKAKGRDIGEILIAEGLAVPFVCGRYRCPKTSRPWC
jgi:micrococcal nuclease